MGDLPWFGISALRRCPDSGTERIRYIQIHLSITNSFRPSRLVATATALYPWRRSRGLRLCGAVPQTTGLPLRGQALDLRPSRASRPQRRRLLAYARTDRCLCGGRLPADDRLYRRRQHGISGLHEKFGFRRVGSLLGVAYRYGRWADTVM